ncbi:MAG TPA: hypothetical protein VMV93_06685 [Chloroflexota bacterium]|nr:hypothetical protein [Chloroflexota bacterium]
MAKLVHLGLIGVLCLAGILMAIAMIPLIALILLGMLVFNLSGGKDPRELTRRVALAPSPRQAN